jgi:predicted aspartyl protease
METDTMGKVLVAAKIENLQDLWDVHRSMTTEDKVRRVEVPDALVVDTGATGLSMPKRMIEQLGLLPLNPRRAMTTAGLTTFRVFGGVRLTVQGRDCICDVAELPDECPVLIGQIPLEGLDLVVDTVGRRLVGNPQHGVEHMIEMY